MINSPHCMVGVVIPCQHQFNDESLCEANRNAIIEATLNTDSWECITVGECPNGCISFSREFQTMMEWAIEAAKQLIAEDRHSREWL